MNLNKRILLIAGGAGVVLCLCLAVIGIGAVLLTESTPTPAADRLAEVLPTPTVKATNTLPPPPPADTPLPPTDTPVPPAPTDTPAPVYQDPVVLFEISGAGEQVTDNYQLPGCNKAIFYWTAQPGDTGAASLIAYLHNVATGEEFNLVNEFEMDLAGDLTGAAIQALAGGEYFVSTENTDQPWTIRLECQDGQAPAASGIDIQGKGVFVTPNYELPACSKSVFAWSVQPGDTGTASLIAYLVNANENRAYNLANEFEMDLTAPLEGEALQSITPGLYYLVIQNTQQAWHIWWECRD